MKERPVALMDMLDARERRMYRQQELLGRYPGTLICFTMNIAGPVKNSDLIFKGYRVGIQQLENQLKVSGMQVLHFEETTVFTGNEGFFAVNAEPLAVKTLTCQLEEDTELGRLFDIDVLRQDASKVSREEIGYPVRTCLLCGKAASVCASRRLHTVEALQAKTTAVLNEFLSHQFAAKISALAAQSLLYEVCVTPKPGLVDRSNSGAHWDMNIYTFLRSTAALAPWFHQMTEIGIRTAAQMPEETFGQLQFAGKAAEGAMRDATGGINTHKGAIFSLGTICGAFGRLYGQGKAQRVDAVLDESAAMTKSYLLSFCEAGAAGGQETAGARSYRKYGITGVRGEVANGFPTVRSIGLPMLKKLLSDGYSNDEAGSITLLYLIANMTDTNLIARSDYATQQLVKEQIAELLQETPRPSRARIERLDRQFINSRLSPGGCADLLAVCWLLYFFEKQ